jgi:hypothetical protein
MSGIVTMLLEVRVVQTEGRAVTPERAAHAVAAHLRADPIVKVPAMRAGKPATVAVLSAEVSSERDRIVDVMQRRLSDEALREFLTALADMGA